MRETERLASINQNHHHRSLTHQPRRWPIHSNLPNFKYLKPNTNMIFLWCCFSTPYVCSLYEYVIVVFLFFAEDDCELNIWIID